ncbi:MAG: sigma-70 family RNA polymerase sigma factor [Actinomycetota bacterium]|nr:sigma-70 family RNA polymerase sigma factor [Actinomycetota bacterium]
METVSPGKKRPHDDFLAATLPALDLVYNLARRLVSANDVEDLVQETYTRAFGAWAAGRPPKKVEPWIATICLNTGRSWLRRASNREIPSEPDPALSATTDVSAEAMERLQAEQVHEALWQLPEAQRIAIALMDLDGFSASQVAAITGSPRGTVLARVHRGRKKLARLLESEVNRRETRS